MSLPVVVVVVVQDDTFASKLWTRLDLSSVAKKA